MCAQDINGKIGIEQVDIVGANDRIIVVRQHVIETHLLFNPFVGAGPVVDGGLGVGNHARKREAQFSACLSVS